MFPLNNDMYWFLVIPHFLWVNPQTRRCIAEESGGHFCLTSPLLAVLYVTAPGYDKEKQGAHTY